MDHHGSFIFRSIYTCHFHQISATVCHHWIPLFCMFCCKAVSVRFVSVWDIIEYYSLSLLLCFDSCLLTICHCIYLPSFTSLVKVWEFCSARDFLRTIHCIVTPSPIFHPFRIRLPQQLLNWNHHNSLRSCIIRFPSSVPPRPNNKSKMVVCA